MLKSLDHENRMRLMRFVCSMAWADLKVNDAERAYVRALIQRLQLDPHETALVERWLKSPPAEESVDPTSIPHEHKQVFLETLRGLVKADGRVTHEEREALELIAQLIR